MKLLRRTPRLVQATDEGIAFRGQVGRVLEQLDDATAALRNSRALVSGNLRVTAPYDLGVAAASAPLVAELVERFPGVSVEMVLTEAVLNFESHQIDSSRCGPGPRSATPPRSSRSGSTRSTSGSTHRPGT